MCGPEICELSVCTGGFGYASEDEVIASFKTETRFEQQDLYISQLNEQISKILFLKIK